MGKVAPVEREIVYLSRFDNLAKISTCRVQLGRDALHRHHLCLGTDGQSKIKRCGLSDRKREIRNPLHAESFSRCGNHVPTRANIEKEISTRIIGCGRVLDV